MDRRDTTTDSRFTEDQNKRLTAEELLQSAVDDSAIQEKAAQQQSEDARVQMQQAYAIAERMQLRKKMLKQRTALLKKQGVTTIARTAAKNVFRAGLIPLLIVYLIQLVLALITLTALFGQGVLDTYVQGIISLDTLKDTASIAMGINMILSIALFLILYVILRVSGIDPFKTSGHFIFTVVCFGLNLFPITNLLPWFLIWSGYFLLSSMVKNAKGVT